MVVDDIPNGFTGFANKNFQYSRDIESAKGNEAVPFDPEKLSHISELDRRWSWVEVDLNAIRHNVMLAKQKIDRRCRLLAVVKADAYGHGAVRVAKTALNSGAEYLGVATIDEAIELREALINAPVLILSEPPIASIPLLLAYKVMPTVYTPEFVIQYAELADAHNIRAPYHLKINTGMNRIGVRHDEVLEADKFSSRLRPGRNFYPFCNGRYRRDSRLPNSSKAFFRSCSQHAGSRYQPGHRPCIKFRSAVPLS